MISTIDHSPNEVTINLVVGSIGSGKLLVCEAIQKDNPQTKIISYKDISQAAAPDIFTPAFSALDSGFSVAMLNGGNAFVHKSLDSMMDKYKNANVVLHVPERVYTFITANANVHSV